MFKKSAEMSCHPSPVAYCIYLRVLRGEAHGHYYLTRHRVRIKKKKACSGRGGTATGCAVFLQQGHAAEGARTGGALVFLHIRVGLQVRAQVRTVCEGTVTVWAREWTFTCAEKKKSKNYS